MIPRIHRAILALFAIFTCLQAVVASSGNSSDIQYVTYQEPDGTTVYLNNDRQPSLYTGNYGDCLGNSLINFTRFDAAYYKDNMTVLFHLEGTTALDNENLVLYISVYAYGETRFTFIFNPCAANIHSLCPLQASVPIVAQGIIPVSVDEVSAIPAIALTIPDFEGQAVLRVYANRTESEIGCYSAVLTNGKSFGHPKAIGSALGGFAAATMVASFATAIYGGAVSTMRLHYAHSLSTGVVMAVFQHIFFTGALSMNWPSVLVAWWSNFAWAGGMVYLTSMQRSIDKLVGNNIGSTSEVGAAPAGSTQNSVGGSPDISEIYKRSVSWGPNVHQFEESLLPRTSASAPLDGYTWYGYPVGNGLPLPGNYSGFAGTLAEENIPVSNAFMTGFLWFLVVLAGVIVAIVVFKGFVELLALLYLMDREKLKFFREHWLGYTAVAALRTCYIGFFAIMFLTIFEFTFTSSGGVKGVAAAAFVVFFIGMVSAAYLAIRYKKRSGQNDAYGQPREFERKKLLGVIPFKSAKKGMAVVPDASIARGERVSDEKSSTLPQFKRTTLRGDNNPGAEDYEENIHDNDEFTMKFGWLASRFRRTKWWLFAAWIFYEFLRAAFYGGASGSALVQVFGLLVIEVVAFAFLVWTRPFEGRRLNILVVYCLGFSKIACVALSAAFDNRFGVARITTTVIGIVIIVIQGILTIITLIAIVVGLISSYMSVSRNEEDFRPRRMAGIREKYFDHLDRMANDVPREPEPEPKPEPEFAPAPIPPASEPEVRTGPYFEMRSVKRLNKIEDEDEEDGVTAQSQVNAATLSNTLSKQPIPGSGVGASHSTRAPVSAPATPLSRSRASSMRSVSSGNLPFGARQHRPSWSTRDLNTTNLDHGIPPVPAIDASSVMQSGGHDFAAVATPKHSHSRPDRRSLSWSKTAPSKPTLKGATSAGSLRVGGEVSSFHTIGNVPAPVTRPRAGTGSSSRTHSLTSISHSEWNDWHAGPSSNQRASRVPLTPAMELDEWGSPSPEMNRR